MVKKAFMDCSILGPRAEPSKNRRFCLIARSALKPSQSGRTLGETRIRPSRKELEHMTNSTDITGMRATAARQTPDGAQGAAATPELGAMPELNLADLYPGPDSEELKGDLERARAEAEAFQARHQGKLEDMARGEGGGAALAGTLREYEALQDLI